MIILFFVLLFSVKNFAEEPIIKSLHVYKNSDVTVLPVINQNSSDKLTISFDIEAEHEPDFNIIFKFMIHYFLRVLMYPFSKAILIIDIRESATSFLLIFFRWFSTVYGLIPNL